MSAMELVNAPAGSGKSTAIKSTVRSWAEDNPNDKMLVITYTNRAADELKPELLSTNIHVSTIHSFFNSFARSLFSSPEVVDYYFEIYAQAIKARISNTDHDARIAESNKGYEERLGAPLTFELIADSVQSLYYNERPFNTLFRGGLSHDDLLSFVAACGRRFPAINRRISGKYQQVIIDEYQDTSVDVLEFFLNATSGTDCHLRLYGDRMQQIYKTELRRFHGVIEKFDEETRTVTNFRSSAEIVSALNNIYNDDRLRQQSSKSTSSTRPRAHFTSDPIALGSQLQTESTLTLSVHNAAIFASLGATSFFKAVSALPEHGYGSQFSAVSVLTEPDWEKVQNPLIRFLFGLLKLEEDFKRRHIGSVVRLIREHPTTFGSFTVDRHEHKAQLNKELNTLLVVMAEKATTIRGVIECFEELESLTASGVSSYLSEADHSNLLDVPFDQVRSTNNFNKRPMRSTQHGVKGESHDSVIFIAETSRKSPVVHMDSLFDLWPHVSFSLDTLERLVIYVTSTFAELQAQIGLKISALKADTFSEAKDQIVDAAHELQRERNSSDLFAHLYGAPLDRFLTAPTVTNAKDLFKSTRAEGLLAAYKLFYVGCSRARDQLDVIIASEDLRDPDASRTKLASLGFDVTASDTA